MTQENEHEYEIPSVTPGLEEVPVETPEKDKYKKPPIPPEKIREIIDMINLDEKEDKEHEKEVENIIKKIHQ